MAEISILVVFVLLIILVKIFGGYLWGGTVRSKLRAFNLEPVHVRFHPWRSNRRYHSFSFEAKTRDGETVTGSATKPRWSWNVALEFDGDDPGVLHLRNIAAQSATMTVEDDADLETQILFETNQRLERLQGDREQYLATADHDGDGMVDDEEWAATRAQIEAEVRAELTGTGVPTVLDHADSDSADHGVVATEVEGDGHW